MGSWVLFLGSCYEVLESDIKSQVPIKDFEGPI